jgi:hypothetical protein
MTDERLLDRDTPPEPDLIRRVIGREVFPVWEDVNRYLRTQYPDYDAELTYYNAQRGWGLHYRKGPQRLCMLFPERGGFTALLALTPEEDQAALDKIHFFNARIRELLNQPSTLPQGRWLWMRIEDHTDFVGFKMLLELKTIE